MRKVFFACLYVLILGGCGSQQSDPTPTPLPTFTPTAVSLGSPVDQLQAAYVIAMPDEREAAVLTATRSFLVAQNVPETDEEASSLYNTIVSDYTITPTIAVIRRLGEVAIISLPDGLGIYLYDLNAPDSLSLALTQWNIGLTGMDFARNETELGVGYITADTMGNTQLHFALAGYRSGEWRLLWHSDQSPEWWYANRNAEIAISDDLSTLLVTGEATNTTEAFDETGRPLFRTLTVRWRRFERGYRIDPPREGYSSDAAWHWSVSQPSAYNSLVEFVERLQAGDEEGAEQLVASDTVLEAAQNFGLDLPQRLFVITSIEADTITFRDTRGAFVATIDSPNTPGGEWLISDIRPLGAPTQPTQGAP